MCSNFITRDAYSPPSFKQPANPLVRERSRTVQMQGGNDVDYPGVIPTSYQRSRCAVIGHPAGRRGEDQQTSLFVKNAINSTYYMEHHLKPSRIKETINPYSTQ